MSASGENVSEKEGAVAPTRRWFSFDASDGPKTTVCIVPTKPQGVFQPRWRVPPARNRSVHPRLGEEFVSPGLPSTPQRAAAHVCQTMYMATLNCGVSRPVRGPECCSERY